MLKASQLSSDGRNDSILMIVVSNDQPPVPAAPINTRQRRSVATLIRAAVSWRWVLWVSCPIRLWAQSPASNEFYCAQETSGYDSKPVDRRAQAKICPSIVESVWWYSDEKLFLYLLNSHKRQKQWVPRRMKIRHQLYSEQWSGQWKCDDLYLMESFDGVLYFQLVFTMVVLWTGWTLLGRSGPCPMTSWRRSSRSSFVTDTLCFQQDTTVNRSPARTVDDGLDEVEAQPTVRTVRLAIERPLFGCLRGRTRFEWFD